MLDVGLKTTRKKDLTGCTKKKPQTSSEAFLCGIRQRPTLPGDFSCLNPAQRAAEKILTKYNVAHSLKTTGEMDVTDAQSFFHAFLLLSQVFPHVLDPPLAAHMGEPNQVQCRTFIEDD